MFEGDSYGEIQSTILPDTGTSRIVVQTLVPSSSAPSHSQLNTVPRDNGGSASQTRVFGKSIIDTNAFVTYHRDEETGGLIETSVSSNTNHVTARSVNSPQDVFRSFNKNVDKHDKPKLHIHKGYDYVPETRRANDTRNASFILEREFSIPGNEKSHHTVVRTLSNDAASDTEISQHYHRPSVNEYFVRKHHRSEDEYSRDQRSPLGSQRKQRTAEKQQKLLASSRSNYSLDRGFSSRVGMAPASVRLLPSGRREHAIKRAYVLPRYHSLDSSRPIYVSPKHQDTDCNLDYLHDDHGEDVYVGKDNQLYIRKEKENNPRDENYFLYPLSEHYSDIEQNNSSDDVDFDALSLVSSSDEEAYLIGNHKVKNYNKIKRKDRRSEKTAALINGDFKHIIPIYTHRSRRRESPVLNKYYDKSFERKRRRFRAIRVIPSSYSDDDNVRDEEDHPGRSNKKFSTTTPRSQLRQRKPEAFQGNEENVSTMNITSLNENSTTPYSLGAISPMSSFNTNFALYSTKGYSLDLTNPYMNFPYSITPGHMDLLRNSSLNVSGMRSYVDAMSTSLANIPASTIGTSPYATQQLLEQHGLDTLDNVETQDFFKNANPISVFAKPAEVPVFHTDSRSELQPTEVLSFTEQGIYNSDSSSARAHSFSGAAGGQNTAFEDLKDYTQEHYYSQGVNSRNGTGLKGSTSEANKSTISSGSSDMSVNTDTLLSNGKNGQDDAMHCVTPSKIIKSNVLHRQISNQSSSQPLPYEKPKDRNLKHSAVQTDSYENSLPTRIPTPPQPPLIKPGFAPPVSKDLESHLKRTTSKDTHSRTVPPTPSPATLPKPKITSESLSSAEPLSPSKKVSSPVFANRPRSSSAAQVVHDLTDDDIAQSMSSTFFAITNLTVIESPDNTNSDIKSGIKKNIVKARADEYNALACGIDEKYSITQISSTPLPYLPASIHPEADYDVYPRKSSSAQANPQTNITETAKLPIKSLPQHSNSADTQVTHYSTNSLPHSSQEPRSSHVSACESFTRSPEVFRSRLESPEIYTKAYTTPSKTLEYPTNKIKKNSQSPQFSGVALGTSPHSVKSLHEANRLPNKSLRITYQSLTQSAKPPDVHSGATRSQIQKIDEAGTDIRDIPYQFYTGDPSLSLSPNNITQVPSFSIPPACDDKTQITTAKSDHSERKELESESNNAGYIFYKGPDTVKIVPKQTNIPVLDHTQQTILYAETTNVIKETEDPVANLDNKKFQREVPEPRSINSDVPIPLRDFDSDADSSEYIYTSGGWSHVLTTPNITKVMFCTGVEDNSAMFVDRMCRGSLKKGSQNESILDRFIRDCLPKYKNGTSLTNGGFPKTTRLFDKPFRRQLSTSTLSLKWNSDMDLAQAPYMMKNTLFDALAQNRPRSHDSADLDSGVSLASQNSRRQSDSSESDTSLIPKAHYSTEDSDLSSTSMELGCDYLSCNESIKKRSI